MFIVLLFVAAVGGSMAAAQQEVNNQEQPLMTPVSGPATNVPTDSRESFFKMLDLKMYEAAAGDLSLCKNDGICLVHARKIQSWICAAGICNGIDKSKEPTACFEGASQNFSIKVIDQINSSICPLIKYPGTETRRALLSHAPDFTEDELVEYGAYLLPLKGSAVSCEDYIKNYVGAYGHQWNYKWYRALSGCRILAHERNREQEEKDFSTWSGVAQGLGKCSDIVNSEMRNACNAPGSNLFNYGK